MTTPDLAGGIETAIPDLTGIPLDRIAAESGPGLARAIDLYRERLRDGAPLALFNARI